MMWAGDMPTLGQGTKDRQYRAIVIEYPRAKTLLLLNIRARHRRMHHMRHLLPPLAMIATLALPLGASAADCYADYKAKQDNPLRLHYGVIQLQDTCKPNPAQPDVSARLARGGWTLLNIMSVFGPEGLDQRRANAGDFFLRF